MTSFVSTPASTPVESPMQHQRSTELTFLFKAGIPVRSCPTLLPASLKAFAVASAQLLAFPLERSALKSQAWSELADPSPLASRNDTIA
jgi:hypothetical protein